ncbi:MAG TPA: hypothetical protein VGA22_07965 [Gemmatimonadales bacterium]|jgi:hypothetical protein
MSEVTPATHRFDTLDADEISATIAQLARRIDERLPGASLARLCRRLEHIARHTKDQVEWIKRPILSLRVGSGILILIVIVGLAMPFAAVGLSTGDATIIDIIQALEAGINDVVLIGAGIFFLATLENRIKRRRALAALHQLRTITHIIDMLQLTKDPERLFHQWHPTPSSSAITLTPFLLSRYLDYCSDMLSLTGKIAALYVQDFHDPVALATVNEIETLATGLTGKIWQKLVILHAHPDVGPARSGAGSGVLPVTS